jgi:hypothetical protein
MKKRSKRRHARKAGKERGTDRSNPDKPLWLLLETKIVNLLLVLSELQLADQFNLKK